MYNRYLRNDHGDYTHIVREESSRTPQPPPPPDTPPPAPPPPPRGDDGPEGGETRESFAFLGRILERLHLQDLDGADLMLLALLFFLFEEKADDELLIALGLLLIL